MTSVRLLVLLLIIQPIFCEKYLVKPRASNDSLVKSSSSHNKKVNEISDLKAVRAFLKFDQHAADLLAYLDESNYYGSCLTEGVPIILNNTRLVGLYLIKYQVQSEEECWCKCLEFDGCYASLYAWGTCHIYDLNYLERKESGFTAYLKVKKVEYSYIGCYKDDPKNRDMSYLAYHEFLRNSNDYCASLCDSQGYTYFATQFGNECYCANSYGKYGKSDQCNSKCWGTEYESTCGGLSANSVYEIKR